MATVAAAGVLAGAPGLAQAQAGASDGQLAALLNAFADEMLRVSPETATGLGLDKDARADLKSKLSDVSRGSLVADQRSCYAMLRRMWAIDPASLSTKERTRYEAVQYALRLGAQAGDFRYGDNTFKWMYLKRHGRVGQALYGRIVACSRAVPLPKRIRRRPDVKILPNPC